MSFGGGFGGRDRGGGGGGGGESEVMMVDSRSVGRIIGRGGSKIRDLQDESGAKIQVARDDDGSGQKSVEISGSADEIACARRLIDDCLNSDYGGGGRGGGGGFGGGRRDDDWGGRRGGDRDGGYGRRDGGYGGDRRGGGGGRGGGFGGGFGGGETETIHVESSEVGRIIGRGGSRIREMEEGSQCRIKVSRDGDSRGLSSVDLTGSRDAIAAAKSMISEAGVDIQDSGSGGGGSGSGW